MFLNDRKRLIYTFNLSHYNHNNCKMKYWKYHLNFNFLFSQRQWYMYMSYKNRYPVYKYILTIIYKRGLRKAYMA